MSVELGQYASSPGTIRSVCQ